jgi:hypothetical protein
LKLLWENIGRYRQRQSFSEQDSNCSGDKDKIDNGIASNSKLLHIKGNKYQNQQPIEWEKIFATYSADKGLISRIIQELKKLNSKRTNNLINKWTNELNSQSSDEVQVAN